MKNTHHIVQQAQQKECPVTAATSHYCLIRLWLLRCVANNLPLGSAVIVKLARWSDHGHLVANPTKGQRNCSITASSLIAVVLFSSSWRDCLVISIVIGIMIIGWKCDIDITSPRSQANTTFPISNQHSFISEDHVTKETCTLRITSTLFRHEVQT